MNNISNDNYALDWDDEINVEEPEFTILPEGDYAFEVTKVERGRYEGGEKIPPCPKAIVSLKVFGENEEAYVTESLLLCKKMEWKISQFFLSLGLKKHGEPFKPVWNRAVGLSGKCRLEVNHYKDKNGNDRENNRVKRYYDHSGNASAASQTPAQKNSGWKAGSF